MKWIYCLLLLLCPYGNRAQVLPLRVGDTLPTLVLHNVYNSAANTITIPGSEGTYTIMDFWASNCRSCIEGFDKMHRLQVTFGNSLQVLMANSYTRDSLSKVTKLFASLQQRTGLRFTLPCLLQDTLLSQYFPYTYLPHCVWINRSGRVDAITGPEELTEPNIRQWLGGKLPAMAMKDDALRYDEKTKPVMDTGSSSGILYRSVITAGKKELGNAIGRQVDSTGLVTHFYMINSSLQSLYRYACPELDSIPFRQLYFDSAVRHLFSSTDRTTAPRYSYEYSGKPLPQEQLPAIMRAALEQCFGIAPVILQQPISCYVLTANSPAIKIKSRGGQAITVADTLSLYPRLQNQPISDLLAVFSNRLPLPLLDETGISYPVDLKLPKGFYHYTVAPWQAWLQQYGLVLTETTRTLPVASLQPINRPTNNCSPKQLTQ